MHGVHTPVQEEKMSGKGKRGGSKKTESIEAALANMSLKADNGADQRTVTGVLCSHPLARDIKFENFSLQCYGFNHQHDP